MNKVTDDINRVLLKHGIDTRIASEDLYISEKLVTDALKQEHKLSVAIAQTVWPSIPFATVYHYTSREAAESILRSRTFRLTNIEKRHGEGEVVTFCKTHELDGYLKPDSSGTPFYRSLMRQLFYASFTEASLSSDEEQYFWRTFAGPDGVRLKFEITSKNPNFHRIVYEPNPGEPIALIRDLASAIRSNNGRHFILQGISRLCAFYLCGRTYGRENELRALVKIWPDLGPKPKGAGAHSYIEMPLDEMVDEIGFHLKITEVNATSPLENMPFGCTFNQRGD